MVLDFKNDLDFATQNGISISKAGTLTYIYFNKDIEGGHYSDVTFKNFPNIHIDDVVLTKCCFEDCELIEISDSQVIECSFENTPWIRSSYTDFKDCVFRNIETQTAMLDMDSQGDVDGCTFENIRALGEEGRISSMIVDKESLVSYLTNCRFVNCTVEEPDGSLSLCVYYSIFKRKKEVENIDIDTCEIINSIE